MNKSAKLLSLVEAILDDPSHRYLRDMHDKLQPFIKHHAERYTVQKQASADPQASELVVHVQPKLGSSVQRLIAHVGQHVPIASTPVMGQRKARVLFHHTHVDGIDNRTSTMQVDFHHRNAKEFAQHIEDNKTHRDMFHATDPETEEFLKRGDKKPPKQPSMPDQQLLKRYKLRTED